MPKRKLYERRAEPFCRDCADSDGRCMHNRRKLCDPRKPTKQRRRKG